MAKCSADTWCKEGLCPGWPSCFAVASCNIQDLVQSGSLGSKNEATSNGQTANFEDASHNEPPTLDDNESKHAFCGTDWNLVNNECGISQNCPTGRDEECEQTGAKCFLGTRCDASKGHGEYFEYFKVPYYDARNRLYCKYKISGVFNMLKAFSSTY